MRSAIAIAAFAAHALAAPFAQVETDIVTDVDVVAQTDYVTVTGDSAPAETEYATVYATETSSADETATDWHRWGGWHSWGGNQQSTTETPAPAPTSTEAPPPPPSTTEAPPPPPPTTTEAPPPPPTTTSTEAPPPPPPVTTQAPAPPVAGPPGADQSGIVATGTSDAAPSTIWTATSAAYSAYSSVAVLHHNFHRANYSSPPIEWDDSVAADAAKVAQTCHYAHSLVEGAGQGQNIAAGIDQNNITEIITDLFYNGEVNALEADPGFQNGGAYDHLSQIVWANTKKFGCATANCTIPGITNAGTNVGPYFTVCNYYPAANVGGEYGTNIGKSLNLPTIEWNAS